MSLVSDTQELINDSGVFWPAQQVYDALNESMLEVWQDLEVHTTTATITLAAGDEFVPLPTTIMSPKTISIGGVEWFVTSRVQAERWNHKWKTTSLGMPKHWIIYGAETLMPYPRPNLAYLVVISGVAWPLEEITGANLDIAEDSKIKRAIMWRAAATLAEHTRPDLVQAWAVEIREADKQAAKILGRNWFGKHIKRLRPSTHITVAHQGDIGFGRLIGTRG